MGRRKKPTTSEHRIKPVSNRRSYKAKKKKARVTPKELPLLKAEELSDFRIEVRRNNAKGEEKPSYERLVRLKTDSFPSGSEARPLQSECSVCTNKVSQVSEMDTKLLASDDSTSFQSHYNQRHSSDYPGKIASQESRIATRIRSEPDWRRKSNDSEKKFKSRSPVSTKKSQEYHPHDSESVREKSFSAPPTPVRDIFIRNDGKKGVAHRGDTRTWESHPYNSRYEEHSGIYFGQHFHHPSRQDRILSDGLGVERLKNTLSEVFKATPLNRPSLEYREPLADGTGCSSAPNLKRRVNFQDNYGQPVSGNRSDGRSLSVHTSSPLRQFRDLPGRFKIERECEGRQEGVAGLHKVIHGQHERDCLNEPMGSRCSNTLPGFSEDLAQVNQTDEPHGSRKGVSRKRKGSSLSDHYRKQARLDDQKHVAVTWVDQQRSNSVDFLPVEQGAKGKDKSLQYPTQCRHQSMSPIKHDPAKYDMTPHQDEINFGNMTYPPLGHSQLDWESDKKIKSAGSSGPSPRLGEESAMVKETRNAATMSCLTVRFQDSAAPVQQNSPDHQDIPAGKYRWEFFGKEPFSAPATKPVEYSPSDKFSLKFGGSRSDISLDHSSANMGPSTAMIGLQSTATPSGISGRYLSVGRNDEHVSLSNRGIAGYASPRGRGFSALGHSATVPVAELGRGDGLKKSVSASGSWRGVPLDNLKVLIRGSDRR